MKTLFGLSLARICGLWVSLASVAWAAPIQISSGQLYVHSNGTLIDVFDTSSANYFSTIGGDGFGFFGWTFTNGGSSPITNLTLTAFLDADIDRDDNTFFNEYGEFLSLTLPPFAPLGTIGASTWEIDEPGFLFGDILLNATAGLLDNSNGVPSVMPDDASLALQFLVGSLDPGLAATVRLYISPTNINGLQQIDPDSDRSFYFNGYAQVDFAPETGGEIPEPATWTLMLAAGGLALAARRRLRLG